MRTRKLLVALAAVLGIAGAHRLFLHAPPDASAWHTVTVYRCP